jgi:hypothetical protein
MSEQYLWALETMRIINELTPQISGYTRQEEVTSGSRHHQTRGDGKC